MKNLLLSLSMCLFFTACAPSIKVIYDYDKEADFKAYKSYSLLKWGERSAEIVNDLDKRRIEDAVNYEMKARGYTKLDSAGALDVGVHITLTEKTDYTSYTDYYGTYGYRRMGWGYGGVGATTTVTAHDYIQGTLIINVMDAKEKKLLWQGSGTGTVDKNPNNNEKKVKYAIGKIMYSYPIRIQKKK